MRLTISRNGIQGTIEADPRYPEEMAFLRSLIKEMFAAVPVAATQAVPISSNGTNSKEQKDLATVSSDSKQLTALQQERLHRIVEAAQQINRPFIAQDIADVVKSEKLFKTSGGDPIHVIRNLMRNSEGLFDKDPYQKWVLKGFLARMHSNESLMPQHSLDEIGAQEESNLQVASEQ